MARLHRDGLYEARLPSLSSLEGGIDYHFEVRPESGEPFRLDDPYRFGRSVSDYDLHLFGEGTLLGVHDRLGAHPTSIGGTSGVHFAVWAPNAQRASVVGDFNDWDGRVHPMRRLVPSGIWEVFIPGLGDGERYKFEIRTTGGHLLHKADPYGRYFEIPPRSAAIVCRTDGYTWGDGEWMAGRVEPRQHVKRPMATYEVHLASWRHGVGTYRELGAEIVDIDLPHAKYAIAVYYIIATAEASSNLARFDGVRYGFRAEDSPALRDMYRRTRDEGFGPEVKRRVMLGTYVLSAGYYDAYYLKAQKVRALLRQDFANAFAQCDAVLTPTAPTPAFLSGEKVDDPLAMYLNDIYTVTANLAGIPGISVPCGLSKDGLPIGLQLLGPNWSEARLFNLAHAYQKARPLTGRPRIYAS